MKEECGKKYKQTNSSMSNDQKNKKRKGKTGFFRFFIIYTIRHVS